MTVRNAYDGILLENFAGDEPSMGRSSDSSALSNGEREETSMLTDHIPIFVDKWPRIGFCIFFHKFRKTFSLADEAYALTVSSLSCRKSVLPCETAHVVSFCQITQWKENIPK